MKSLFNASRNNRSHKLVRNGLTLESLETRQLMAADIALDTATRTLYIEGTDAANDSAIVRIDTKNTASTSDDRVVVSLESRTSGTTTTLNMNYSMSSVRYIVFNGYAGNDRFDNRTAIASEIDGGSGDDVLFGGTAADDIYGGNGKDYIDGRAGNDNLYGGAHNDIIFGDLGNDNMYGGSGDDAMFGGAGADALYGESGVDLIDGGANIERVMNGGTGVDTFVDDTKSFPGGDFSSQDRWSTQHPAAARFDYDVANATQRSDQRFASFQSVSTPTPVSFNAAILAFAQSKLGTKVGDGGCTRLVEEALNQVGAKPGENFNSPGNYVWGRLVGANETVLPGDIVQFGAGTKFQTANSSLFMDSFFGHAGIIESVSGTTITILNQNMAGSPVIRTTIDLATRTAGSVSIYRAVAK